MPIYDLSCEKCNEVVEKILKVDQPLPVCEKCGGVMKRLISAKGISFRLYGEGFDKRSHKDTGEFS